VLEELRDKIKGIMLGEVRDIIVETRNGGIVVIEEKIDGDSATNADIQIGNIFRKKLKELLPNSIVINEEDFNDKIYEEIKRTRYVWVVDPIDGTKAFRTSGNNEYCVAVALLDNLNPVLSVVYAPEYELDGEKGLLFEAIDTVSGAFLNGRLLEFNSNIKASDIKCINHIHRDTEPNSVEKGISKICKSQEIIRAYAGHSTLVNYALVAADNFNRVFTRRGANIWDIVQSAYIVEKAGGSVYYLDGRDIFPIRYDDLKLDGSKLLMEFNIASAKSVKEAIISRNLQLK
jgi:myo-inositol-1(or 4)-monophosphatase